MELVSDFCQECAQFFQKYQHNTWWLDDFLESSKICGMCAAVYELFGEDEISDLMSNLKASYEDPTCSLRVLMNTRHQRGGNFEVIAEINYDSGLRTRIFSACVKQANNFARPLWSNTIDLSLSDRMLTAFQWIKECESNHPECRNPFDSHGTAASRFLDVAGQGNNSTIRLVTSQHIERLSYAALSHCWGEFPIQVKTTRDNFDNYQQEITINSLPKTFQEAIAITRILNIQYLWIDSMCIIQDDPMDWEVEASKMSSVFLNARITISASSASNAYEGTGIADPLPCARQVYTGGSEGALIRELSIRYPRLGAIPIDFEKHPVHKRGWILQEKVLSKRILHMTAGELVWQCHSIIESESGYYSETKQTGPYLIARKQWEPINNIFQMPGASSTRTGFSAEEMWWRCVVSFTQRQLTYPNDIFAAIHGLVRHYQALSGDEPILGLWRKNLIVALSWSVRRHRNTAQEIASRIRTDSLPSWTWMSLPIPFLTPDPSIHYSSVSAEQLTEEAHIHDIQISWSGVPWSSWPSKGELLIRGRFIHIVGRRSGQSEYSSTCRAYAPGYRRACGTMWLDRRLPSFSQSVGGGHQEEEFEAIVLWSKHVLRFVSVICLLVEPAEAGNERYRRIGIAELHRATMENRAMMEKIKKLREIKDVVII